MRTFKFRGKRLDNGKWIIGSHTLIQDADGVWLEDDNLDVVKVVPETMGQFTGLEDRNGIPIYEGDVVRWLSVKMTGVGFMEVGRVEWRQEELRDMIVNRFTTKDDRELTHDLLHKRDLTVVGNIHDNPELLKGGKE